MGCAHASSGASAPSTSASMEQGRQEVFIGRSASGTLLAPPLGKPCGVPLTKPLVSESNSVATGHPVEEGSKPLHTACLHKAAHDGNLQIVMLCLESGIDVDATISTGVDAPLAGQTTSLHIASTHGHAAVVRALLKAGAAVEGRDAVGETALHCAASHGKTKVVRMLLQAGADPDSRDAQDMTPLHWAARMSREDVAEILLDAGASLKAKSGHGYTPYAMAEDWGTAAMANLLKKSGGSR